MFESGGKLGVKGVTKTVVERGIKMLEKWRGKVEGQEMGASEVVMILLSVVVFGLVGKVDEEWLKELVIAFSSRRDMAKVVVKLGFNDKLEGNNRLATALAATFGSLAFALFIVRKK